MNFSDAVAPYRTKRPNRTRHALVLLLLATLLATSAIATPKKRRPASDVPPESAPLPQPAPFQFGADIRTVFPLYLGVQGTALMVNHLEVGLGYGLTPGIYSSTIGSVAATLGGNAAYKGLVEAAYSKNSVIRLYTQFNFSGKSGFRLGLAAARLASSGSAGIDQVLSATTGRDYSTLIALLAAAGKSSEVSMATALYTFELYGGYSLQIVQGLHLTFGLGVLKVFSSDVALSTALPNFNASASGSSLLRNTEQDIQRILSDYGYSPTATLGVTYWF